ncbi:DyP-type peroxidase [Mycena rebaudengoi]|nr:DyP-type peroxidase [Mycena rebaudengoi]
MLPLVTSARKLLDDQIHEQKLTIALNIAFSQAGLNKLNIRESDLNDTLFENGRFQDAAKLGDDPNTWLSTFNGTHVILLASNTTEKINGTLKNLKTTLGDSITEIHSLQGAARPDDGEGHEHFGFLDGISNPFVNGSGGEPNPGQASVLPGEIFLNTTDDGLRRPDLAKNGSFLVFRHLQQLVPGFNKFLADNPVGQKTLGLTKKEGSQLLGARMVGRWKSGAPVFMAPVRDGPELATNIKRNNNFTYAVAGNSLTEASQEKCPFSAHIRKTRPRNDLGSDAASNHHIIRASVRMDLKAVSELEKTTKEERGLAFVCYQSSIIDGFHFVQRSWANNPGFVQDNPGFDFIIGSVPLQINVPNFTLST